MCNGNIDHGILARLVQFAWYSLRGDPFRTKTTMNFRCVLSGPAAKTLVPKSKPAAAAIFSPSPGKNGNTPSVRIDWQSHGSEPQATSPPQPRINRLPAAALPSAPAKLPRVLRQPQNRNQRRRRRIRQQIPARRPEQVRHAAHNHRHGRKHRQSQRSLNQVSGQRARRQPWRKQQPQHQHCKSLQRQRHRRKVQRQNHVRADRNKSAPGQHDSARAQPGSDRPAAGQRTLGEVNGTESSLLKIIPFSMEPPGDSIPCNRSCRGK